MPIGDCKVCAPEADSSHVEANSSLKIVEYDYRIDTWSLGTAYFNLIIGRKMFCEHQIVKGKQRSRKDRFVLYIDNKEQYWTEI